MTDTEKATPLIIDKAQIERFVSAMFFYADPGTFASLRSFYDDRDGVYEIKPVIVGDTLDGLVEAALGMAQRCASDESATVFCPPLATFTNADKANEVSLANGLALSVECDQNPLLARGILEELLGSATIIVLSGGIWLNPETGELEDKLHLHWRLNEATRIPEDHKRLKVARALATMLVGGDSSNKPVVHPIRWPGSWHRKKSPRLAEIISETNNEIDLVDTVEKLRAAVAAAGLDKATKSKKSGTTGKAKADDYSSGEARDTAALVVEITSGRDYHAPLTALAMRYLKGGMKTPQVVVTLRGFMEAVPLSLRDIKDGTVHPRTLAKPI